MNHTLEELKTLVSRARVGETVSFVPYIIGGSGHRYTQEEIHYMRQLIELGSEVHINTTTNKYSDTPLHLAYCHGNKVMVDFLIQNGADETAQRYNGNIPIDMFVDMSNITLGFSSNE